MTDRGFEAMIPQAKVVKESKSDYDYNIEFNLFGKRFSLKFKVQNRSEV